MGIGVNPDRESILNVLTSWLQTRLDPASATWVQERLSAIRSGDKKGLYLAFGLTPRKVGKADLALTEKEFSAANSARTGWDPRGWSVDQAVRTLFVLTFPSQESASFVTTLDQLFGTGEVGELVALYQALPLLPHPSAHVLRAAEGIRTNIKAVFCAVAHRNPYPSEQFSDDQWNQMVLKCQFIGVPMSPIVGLDQRANAPLAIMVNDFIHERWAAKRTVTPEMWRCIGRFADRRSLDDLRHVLETGSPTEQQAAALALNDCPDPDARTILSTHTELAGLIAEHKISWTSIEEIG